MMQIPDVFPSCAVTRAMARRNKESVPQSECVPPSDDAAADNAPLNLAGTLSLMTGVMVLRYLWKSCPEYCVKP